MTRNVQEDVTKFLIPNAIQGPFVVVIFVDNASSCIEYQMNMCTFILQAIHLSYTLPPFCTWSPPCLPWWKPYELPWPSEAFTPIDSISSPARFCLAFFAVSPHLLRSTGSPASFYCIYLGTMIHFKADPIWLLRTEHNLYKLSLRYRLFLPQYLQYWIFSLLVLFVIRMVCGFKNHSPILKPSQTITIFWLSLLRWWSCTGRKLRSTPSCIQDITFFKSFCLPAALCILWFWPR